EEHLGALLDHHHVVAHPWHVGAACGGVAEDQGDGGDAGGGEPGEVAEEPPAGDEDLALAGQVGAAGLDQVDQRHPVLLGDLHRPHGLAAGPRVAGAAAHRGVVGDDHALGALDHADAGDDAGADREVAAPGGQRGQLQERRVRVEQQLDPLPGEELATAAVPLDVLLAAAGQRLGVFGVDLGELAEHRLARLRVAGGGGVQAGSQYGHGSSASGTSRCRPRSHSPSALACGSDRVLPPAPSPSSPSTTKLAARRCGKRCRVTGSGAASGISRLNASTVRACASHRQAASSRTHTPTLASEPLSPLRAPATRPSGARRTGPSGGGGGSGGSGTGAGSAAAGAGAMPSRVPSGSTAVCGTWPAGTWAAVNATPSGRASPGGAVAWNPGTLESASSTQAALNARPTLFRSGSEAVMRSSAEAPSWVGASGSAASAPSSRNRSRAG